MQAYDIIGDIHGHASELRALLDVLGYGDSLRHPSGRKAIFLGDYIDRGPKIREVLDIVRGMVEAGSALAILGNHEINAMRFHTKGSDGEFLRPHTEKNVRQHRATLTQFSNAADWTEWLSWFAGLPLSLDLGGLRAVHASWDDVAIAEVNQAGRLEGATLEKYSVKETAAYDTISKLVNGPEAQLPSGFHQETADGAMRTEFRIKWWRDLSGLTCRDAVFPDDDRIPELPPELVPATSHAADAPPTFFGHYALTAPIPVRILPNLACLDYGSGKGGFLCAYRFDGETEIDPEKFVVSA